jgi:hypothetical protein
MSELKRNWTNKSSMMFRISKATKQQNKSLLKITVKHSE